MFRDGNVSFRVARDIEDLILDATAHLEIIVFPSPASKNETNSHDCDSLVLPVQLSDKEAQPHRKLGYRLGYLVFCNHRVFVIINDSHDASRHYHLKTVPAWECVTV
jgi:hypothetical protein